MKLLKHAGVVFLIIIMGLLAVACGGKTEQPTSAPAEKKDEQAQSASAPEKKTYKVVMHAEFPPFEYLDPSGKPVGFEVDLINEMAKEMGWNIEIKNTSWDGVFEEIGSGKAELAISGITIKPDREKLYLFSEPYFQAKQLILVPEGSPIKSLQDIKGHKVGVMTSTTGALIVSDLLGKANKDILQYDEMPSMVEDLYNKRVDVVVADNAFLMEHMKKNPKPGYVTIDDPNIPKENYGIMANKKDTELIKQVNEALKKVKDSGKYDEIYKKYFGEVK
ncbi:basic amino acid ABC transporter substrate-binding protein [Aneurinibacillus sp. UBA3580]|jgi:polar amino acid transport system substrate-binding protein|uniref:basic amino acid ABC transporter substrate-binding protein n=1 Tax=Aneurinibacillus sp. UBA3580 TaxID=1946041 RepID=UPI00257F0FDD|nr:basic amino acid ABC transporter substrate-binding protein [Aneurinibacillus sp. UBA3580]